MLWAGNLMAQARIVRAEWFIGADPGVGQATPFAAITADTLVQLETALAVDTYMPGVYRWHARVQDDSSRWSHTFSRSFLITHEPVTAPVTTLEWFWDEDPGIGQATTVPGISGDSVAVSWMIDVHALTPGVHALYTRVRNASGTWSHTYRRSTLVRAEPQAPIAQINYTYATEEDTLAYTYTFAEPRHYVDLNFEPETTQLVDAVYRMCFTAVRTDGVASAPECRTFEFNDTATGLAALSASALHVYPNPSDGTFRLELPEGRTQTTYLTLLNAQGGEVYRREVAPQADATVALDFRTERAGVYLLVLETGASLRVQRLVIQ